ncbi:nucleotide-binding oligomerization domain-containing protein 1 isoform X2 [Cheilinus undulatus]|nr:nucleotide-binding oligomerization domain-containing protein 1 isoform X2 [Cheilinus undulatus]XP_041649182.1 nucleotide-binding oligomerization domain-containing protein 1 isoform X2 [Cheilinus undulatus]XP_041649183.1 nucleotide-binding oligomerization domain-containing protein 1 isoform X2 [Cheilinus undulatus]XP_041649184.1 nucleotide-binding oligomerization domain-containing protein 1 isoform X2 [Cheilinus undulatus]XP_041649185.1 nucleotide-binding oligomerization domain-containing pro
MDPIDEARLSCLNLLTYHRELLVSQLRSVQCILDNLYASGFICEEDVEIVQQTATKPEQVRKILELVQCKGEEACEFFIYIIYKVCDAYIDLQPWLQEINYNPSSNVTLIQVVNTDPISRYCEKLRHETSRDTSFIMSYGQKEETRLEDLYTDTLMELLNDSNESLGFLESLNQLLDEEAIFNPHGDTIYVTGDAGVGKSILLQKLQNLWSKKELKTNAIFFFKFRCRMFSSFRDAEQISLRDLLFKHNCYPDHDPDSEVFDYILRFPERVIFTFDGYDEIQDDLDSISVPEMVSPEEKAHPLQLLISLLCGKLLKGSQKVLTARTGIEIQTKVIRKKVALRGFSPDHLKTYLNLHFKEQEHRKLVTVQLDASPHLCGLCSTPLFCWIVFKSFSHLHSMHDSFLLPDMTITLTDIFLMLCEVFLSRSTPAPSLLKKSARCASDTLKGGLKPLTAFAKLALKGMERGSFICSQEELSACGLAEDDLPLGFLRPVSEYDASGSPEIFEFLHVTLQSFLAAFALILDEQVAPSSILKFFTECSRKKEASCQLFDFCISGSTKPSEKQPFATNEHLQFTNLFLCGLLSKARTGLMEQLVSPVLLKKKRVLLKSYLSTSIKSHLRGLSPYSSSEGKKVHVLPNFLWILRCIFETGSKDIAQMTAKGITASLIKLGHCNVFSGDCTAINFVLQHRKKLLGLDMDNNNISDYGVKQLQPSFSKMTVVRLCVNHLSDCSIEVLAEELCKHKVVEVLGLYSNHITDVGAKLVAQIIEECPKLRVVKIGKNKITAVGGRFLAQAIQKSTSIFDVGMWGNNIGNEGAEAFAEALRQHPSLTNLSLSANNITSAGGRSLAEALKENTVLRIFWLVQNELTDDAAPNLAELIQANTGLSHLWLINNQFTVDGIRKLSEALTHNTALKEICVKGNQLSEEEEKVFVAEKRLRFH